MRRAEFDAALHASVKRWLLVQSRASGDDAYARFLGWLILHCTDAEWDEIERVLLAFNNGAAEPVEMAFRQWLSEHEEERKAA